MKRVSLYLVLGLSVLLATCLVSAGCEVEESALIEASDMAVLADGVIGPDSESDTSSQPLPVDDTIAAPDFSESEEPPVLECGALGATTLLVRVEGLPEDTSTAVLELRVFGEAPSPGDGGPVAMKNATVENPAESFSQPFQFLSADEVWVTAKLWEKSTGLQISTAVVEDAVTVVEGTIVCLTLTLQ